MSSAGDFTYILTVLTGPNAGAQERLNNRKLLIGGDTAADIILDDFDGAHVEIAVSKGKLRVRSDRDAVRCETGQHSAPGKPMFTQMPATLHLTDEIQVNLSAAHVARKPVDRTRAGVLIAASLILCGVILSAQQLTGFRMFGDATASVSQPDPLELARQQAAAIVAPEPKPEPKPRVTPMQASDTLKAAVVDAGLSGLMIEQDQGVIRVSGLYTDAQIADWQRIRKSYDSSYGHIAPLLISIEEESSAPPLAVASVWLGDRPEVTTRNGEVFQLGQVMETGWRVAAIERKAVHLERGQQRIIIDF